MTKALLARTFVAVGVLLLFAIGSGFLAALIADGTVDAYQRGWIKGFGVGLGAAFGFALALKILSLKDERT